VCLINETFPCHNTDECPGEGYCSERHQCLPGEC
jgi:hypothetical protein